MGEWKSLAQERGSSGWKEIYRTSGTAAWKALQIEGTLDVGGPAIVGANNFAGGYTYICNENPANGSGVITELDINCQTGPCNDVRAGTFYQVSGNRYKCRCGVAIGTLSAGLNSNVECEIDVEPGDFFGEYSATSNRIWRTHNAGGGLSDLWYIQSNACITDASVVYTYYPNNTRMSMYGTG